MGIIDGLWNTAVNIVAVPAKITTRIVDNAFNSDFEDCVDDIVYLAEIHIEED